MRAQFSDPVNIELGQRSLRAYERFADELGQEIDLHQVGLPLPARRPRPRRGVRGQRRAAELPRRPEPDDLARRGEGALADGRARRDPGRGLVARGRALHARVRRAGVRRRRPSRRRPHRHALRGDRDRGRRRAGARRAHRRRPDRHRHGRLRRRRLVARGRGDGRRRPARRAAAPADPDDRADAGARPGDAVHDRLRDQPLLPPRGPGAAARHVRPRRAARLRARSHRRLAAAARRGDRAAGARARRRRHRLRLGRALRDDARPQRAGGGGRRGLAVPLRHRLLRPRLPDGPGDRRGAARPGARPHPARRRRRALGRPVRRAGVRPELNIV